MVKHAEETGGIYNLTGNAKHGDCAYFPGSGPAGRTCTSCAEFNTSMFKNKTSVRGKCARAALMRGCSVLDLSAIYGGTAACKYFVLKPSK